MAHQKIASYLLTHRKKSRFTQEELARLVGYRNAGPVSRQERGIAAPPLSVAFKYSTIFGVSLTELFAGIHDAAKTDVEGLLADFEEVLGRNDGRGPNANAIAGKLVFLKMRKEPLED